MSLQRAICGVLYHDGPAVHAGDRIFTLSLANKLGYAHALGLEVEFCASQIDASLEVSNLCCSVDCSSVLLDLLLYRSCLLQLLACCALTTGSSEQVQSHHKLAE